MKNLKQLSNRITIEPYNEIKRIFSKRLSNAIFYELKENNNFRIFYEKLCDYFLSHNMMNLTVEKLPGRNCLFTDGNGKTTCKQPEYIIKMFDEDICNITFLPKKEGIELYRLEIYNTGKGIGTTLMNIFNQISIETGIKIYLLLGDPGFNIDGDRVKRRNFYHKMGFKRCINSKYWIN